MKPEIKAQWVDALRSGEYNQGRRMLRSGLNEYCCLGVLCDLAVKAGVDVNVGVETLDHGQRAYTYDAQKGMPPVSVRTWAGYAIEDYDAEGILADRNDTGWTFAAIAELIEEKM